MEVQGSTDIDHDLEKGARLAQKSSVDPQIVPSL